MERVEISLAKGTVPTVISMFKKILSVSADKKTLELNASELQKLLDEKGLYSIVASEEMTPQEVHRL